MSTIEHLVDWEVKRLILIAKNPHAALESQLDAGLTGHAKYVARVLYGDVEAPHGAIKTALDILDLIDQQADD